MARFVLYPYLNHHAVRSANWRLVPLWLWFLLIVSFCASGHYFFLWVPYEGAITPQDAIRQDPDLTTQINPNWKALTINHGEVSEWPQGIIEQNPQGYRLARISFFLRGYPKIPHEQRDEPNLGRGEAPRREDTHGGL
jgi:hypothetical protein